jgi:FKBP-type peptidyl-prolyl cis-trans isomerase
MKKLLIAICLFLSVLALHARAIQEDIRQADEKARVSYAFGMLFGSNLSTTPLEFDYYAFTEGFRAMFENLETQITEQEAVEIVETAMHNAMERLAERNRWLEEQFFANNRQRPEIQVTPSGLQYEILYETEGEKPDYNSVVRVLYEGIFMDGSLFDRSDDSEGAYIPLEMVIRGWTEGLMLMSVGSRYRIFIPSELAYGSSGIQNMIPPYSPLIFTVELLEILNLDDEPEF